MGVLNLNQMINNCIQTTKNDSNVYKYIGIFYRTYIYIAIIVVYLNNG